LAAFDVQPNSDASHDFFFGAGAGAAGGGAGADFGAAFFLPVFPCAEDPTFLLFDRDGCRAMFLRGWSLLDIGDNDPTILLSIDMHDSLTPQDSLAFKSPTRHTGGCINEQHTMTTV
jgi:hypothetical protein